MSFHTYTEVYCNGPDPTDPAERCFRAYSDMGNAAQVRERARRDGWITGQPGGNDYCSAKCRDAAKERVR